MELGGVAGRGGAGGPGGFSALCGAFGDVRSRGRARAAPSRAVELGAAQLSCGMERTRRERCGSGSSGAERRAVPRTRRAAVPRLHAAVCGFVSIAVRVPSPVLLPAVLGAGCVPSLCVWVWGHGSLLSQPRRAVMLQEEVLERQRRARSGVGSHCVASHPATPPASLSLLFFFFFPFF